MTKEQREAALRAISVQLAGEKFLARNHGTPRRRRSDVALHNLRCALDFNSQHVYGGEDKKARQAFNDLTRQIKNAI